MRERRQIADERGKWRLMIGEEAMNWRRHVRGGKENACGRPEKLMARLSRELSLCNREDVVACDMNDVER